MSELSGPLNVILADDEEDIRIVGEMALATVGGFRVRTAEGGLEALELLVQERPDVLVLDVMMPVLDGPTTLSRLRESEEGEPLPVIFMTAKIQPQEIASYMQMGAAGVVTKPFDPMLLADQIRRILIDYRSTSG